MATYSAGTAFLDIIPSFRGVQKAIQREVRQMEQALGKDVGDALGNEAEKGIKRAVDKALGTTRDAAGRSGKAAGEQYGSLFEKAVRGRIEAALKNFPDISFDADISDAQEKLMILRARMLELGDKKIGVDIDAKAALAEVEALRHELATVAKDESIDIQVRTDAAGAAAELLEIRSLAELVDQTKIDIKVEMKEGGIIARLREMRTAMTSAGSSGDESANAFRAFNGVILGVVTLLPAVVPVAGAAAGAIALFGAAGIGAAAGLGVMVAAFSGIGDAVKALGKQQNDAAKDTEAASKKMRAASRSVEDAQRGVERATTQASQANTRSARAVEDAVDNQREAEEDLVRAQGDVVRAQEDVTRAREAAVEAIEDLQLSIRGGELAERQAVLDLKEAQDDYNASLSKPDLSADDRAQLLLDLEKAALNLDVVRERNGDLTEEQAEWARTGVDGSSQVVAAQAGVVSAQDRVRDAQDRVADAVVAVADAVADQRQIQIDSAAAIQDAQRNLTQAQEDYQTALYETGTLGSASMQAVAEAMGALGPAGREFAIFINGLRGEMRDLRDIAQAGVLPGVQDAISAIMTGNGPLFREFLRDTANALGDMFRQLGVLFTSPMWQRIFGALAEYAPIFTKQFGEIGMNLLTFFGGLFQGLAPYAERFNQGIIDITDSMAKWAVGLTESSGFKSFMEWLFTEGPKVWDTIKDVGGAILNIMIALAPLGGVILGLIDGLAEFIAEMDPQVLGAILTTVLGLVAAFQVALGAFSLFMIAADVILSPFTRVIFIIGAVVTGLIVLYTTSETFRDIVNGVFRAVGDVIGWWWGNVVAPVFEAFRLGFEALGAAIEWVWLNVLKPVFDGFGSGSWDGLVTGLGTAATNIGTGLQDLGNKVWDFVKPGGTLDNTFLDAWAGLTNNLTDETNENSAAFKIAAWFRGLAEDVWTYLKPGGTLDMVMLNAWGGLTDSLDDETDENSAEYKISKWFGDLPGNVWEFIKPGGELDQKFIGMWDSITKELEGIDLAYSLGQVTGTIARWEVELSEKFDPWARDFWDKFKPESGKVSESVDQFFADLGGRIWENIQPGGTWDEQASQMGKDLWAWLTKPLPITMEELGQWFLDLPGNINEFMKKGGGLDQIGRDLMDGFKNGVSEKWNEFTAWIDEKWESFKQGFRDAFGIKSPSRVFFDFGVNIVEGLLQGILSIYQGVIDWLGRLFGDVTGTFAEMKGNTLLTIAGWRDGAILGATEIWGGMQEKFQRLQISTGQIFNDTKDAVLTTLGVWKDNAVSIATDIWGGVVEKFQRMRDSVKSLFADMVQGVLQTWNGIRSATAGPVNFVINDVLNGGLFKAWNKIIDTLGLNANWKLHIDPINTASMTSTPGAGTSGSGGSNIRLAAGGRVPGWSPNDKADNIPAMLTANEFVQPVDTHRYYGTDVMEMMRKRQIPRELFQFLATGGQVFAAVKKKFPRANLNSGFRPGDPGMHGTGNAVDLGEAGFAGGSGRPYLAAMNQALYDTAKPFIAELIYDGSGDTRPDIKNGKDLTYNAATRAQHANHVHLGVTNLAAFLNAFGSGNVIASAVDAVTGLLGGLWSSATEVFGSLKSSIADPLTKLGTGNPLTSLLGAMAGKLPDAMWDKIKDEVGSIASSVTSAVSGGFNFIIDKITGNSVQSIVQSAASQRGWGSGAQWAALSSIIQRESGWNPNAQNPTSTAYGLFQFLNGTWAGTGVAKTSDPTKQTIAGLNYIASRYGDPIGAAAFWNRNHWYSEGGTVKDDEAPTLYDSGGWLPPGISTVLNATNAPEPILTSQQWDAVTSDRGSGPTNIGVRVFIGDRELTDMVNVVIDDREADDERQLRSIRQ